MEKNVEPLSDEELRRLWFSIRGCQVPEIWLLRLEKTVTDLKEKLAEATKDRDEYLANWGSVVHDNEVVEQENKRLREALEPFANAAQCDKARDAGCHDDLILLTLPGDVIGLRGGYDITVGSLRRARAALQPPAIEG